MQIISAFIVGLIPAFILFFRGAADGAESLIAVLFLVESFRQKDFTWLKNPLTIIIIALWGWYIFSAFFAEVNIGNAIKRGVFWIRHPLFFLAIIFWLAKSEKALKIILWIASAILIYTFINVIFQYINGYSFEGNPIVGGRLTGSLTRPNIGIYMAKISFPIIALFIFLYKNLTFRKIKIAKFSLIDLSIICGIILLTGDRTASILSLAALFGAGILSLIYQPKFRLYIIIAGIFITGFIVILAKTQPVIMNRLANLEKDLGDFKDSPYGQLAVAATKMWQENPITGAGLKNFRDVCPKYKKTGSITYCSLHPHNPYLENLAEGGIIALIIFSILTLYLGFSSLKYPLIAGTIFINFFPLQASQSFFSNLPAVLLWFSVAIAMAVIFRDKILQDKNRYDILEK